MMKRLSSSQSARASLVVASLAFVAQVLAQTDPLPSWNEGPAKDAILGFVEATTTQGSPHFVPPAERIATFDQDGTLWVEHPLYTQVMYCLDRVPAVVKAMPELAAVEPFKTVLSGDREAMAQLSMDDLLEIADATLTGMLLEMFRAEAEKWIASAKDSRWKRSYTELTYQPMQEVLTYSREYAYGPATGLPDTKVGTFSQALYDEAKKNGWTVISMKNDWKRLFQFDH